MHEIEFYVSTNKKWLSDLADRMREISGENFYFKNNLFVFLPNIGEGRFEFHELKEGLSLFIQEMELHKQLFALKRERVLSNDYYILLFSLDAKPFKVTASEERHKREVGGSLNSSVYFGSTGNPFYVFENEAGHKQRIGLIFTKDLIYKYFTRYSIPITVQQLEDLVNDKPIELVTSMDLESLRIAEDIFNANLPAYILSLYHTGNALCLLALFLNNLIAHQANEENYKFDDVSRITGLMNKIALDIGEAPLLERAAEQCMMSKTKFIKLFKTIYKLNYGDYILEKKLISAAELLKTGMPVGDVGYRIGYTNMGHFAAAFKKFYQTTPKQYQMNQAHTEE